MKDGMPPATVRAGMVLTDAREDLELHVRSLRRKLERRRVRGEALDDLLSRIRREEDLIGQMRRREA
jgi:hypothetical protein